MSLNIDTKLRTYLIELIFGFLFFVYGTLSYSLIMHNGKTFSENFQNYSIIIVVYFIVMAIGGFLYIVGWKGMKENEKIEIDRIKFLNKNIDLQNQKLNLEIKKLKKSK